MNDTLPAQLDELARIASVIRSGLEEAEALIPPLNELLAELSAHGISGFESEGPALYCRIAGTSGVLTDERIIYAAVLIMPGGIGATCWDAGEYAERWSSAVHEPPELTCRFVAFDDCPAVVRALIPRHVPRLIASLLRAFTVMAV